MLLRRHETKRVPLGSAEVETAEAYVETPKLKLKFDAAQDAAACANIDIQVHR